MNLTEVTTLMDWIDHNRVDQYVKIDLLRDAILDLFERAQTQIEDIPATLLNSTED